MKIVSILLACCLSSTFGVANSHAQAKASQPDVFLITIDTLRADHVHCYGYRDIQTPALDSLAVNGIRFTRAFTPTPITNSSHASILTGLLPSSHGVTDFAVPLSPTHATWAELLKHQGYHTAAFIGAVILDSRTLAPGLDRGFDYYDNFPEHVQTKSRWGRVERRGMDVALRAESWLAAHPSGPHFVWVHLYDPHDPYEPPAPYSRVYKDHLYDGEIAYADSALGHFIAYLKRHGMYRYSVIVVVGDHGEGLGEHHEETHGIFLYDSTTHVPLILKLPVGIEAGRQVDAQVRTIDILPTVLDLVNSPAPPGFDGASLRPYFTGPGAPDRVAFGETDYPLRFGWAPLRSVRADGVKFIEAPQPELYDLQTDPAEMKNEYQPWNADVQKLRAMLADLRLRQPQPSPTPATVGQSTTDELTTLGYLGPADAGSATNVPEPSLLPDPKDKIEEQNLLHTAMIASDRGRIEESRAALEKVLQLNPQSPTALRQLGELELHARRYASAIEYLTRARALRPDDAAAALYEGQALEATHHLTGARDALIASLNLSPAQFQAHLLLGRVYLALNDADDAEDQLEAAMLLEPASVETRLWLARALIADGSFTESIAQLVLLSRSAPNNPAVFQTLADAYRRIGKNAEASQAESRARLLRQRK
jgi:choline-sulfatase